MPKISAIVPVFQVERYIERCARSLFEQTLDDVQYVFVNDGTNDRSMEILKDKLKDYPDRVEQTLVVNHTSTMGIPATRQDGFNVATGEYVIHCDSDDWWEPDAFEKLYDFAAEQKSDIVVFDYFWNYEDGKELHSNDSYSAEMISSIMRGRVAGYLWNKMIRKDVYSSIVFIPENNMWDDIPVVIQAISQSNTVSYLMKPFYHYFQRRTSTSNDNDSEQVYRKFYDAKCNTDLVGSYLSASGLIGKYSKDYRMLQYRSLLYSYPLLPVSEKYRLFFRSAYPGLLWDVLFDTSLNIKSKLGFAFRRVGLMR